MAIAENPEDARRLTIKRNTRRGRHRRLRRARPGQHRPEGRAAGDGGQGGPVQAVRRHRRLAAVPGHPGHRRDRRRSSRRSPPASPGINLEDISAPRCFEIEARLREALDIPVFHDDQHGTAIVVLAALTNALRVVGKEHRRRPGRHVRRRRGRYGHPEAAARGRASSTRSSPTSTASCTRAARTWSTPTPDSPLRWIADNTNPEGVTGTLKEARASARTSSSASPRRTCWTATTSPPWPTARSSSRSPTRTPRSTRRSPAQTRRGGRHRPLRLPEPDQQRAGLPGRLPRPAGRPVAARSTPR